MPVSCHAVSNPQSDSSDTNPLKQKFRTQRLAQRVDITFPCHNFRRTHNFRTYSRWHCSFCPKTTCGPANRHPELPAVEARGA